MVQRIGRSEVQRAGRNEVQKVDPNGAGLTMIFRIVVAPMIGRNAVDRMTVYPIAEAPKAGLNAVQGIGLNEIRRTYLNLAPRDVRRTPDAALHANRAGRQILNLLRPAILNPAVLTGASTPRADPPWIPSSWVWDRIDYRVCYLFGHLGCRQIWIFWISRRPAANRTALTEGLPSVAALREIPNLRKVV